MVHSKYWLFFVLITFSFVHFALVSSEEVPSIEFDFKPDGRTWKLGYEEKSNDQSISQYLLDKETMAAATQLVTVQVYTNNTTDPKIYFKNFVKDFQQEIPEAQVESKIISEDKDSLLGEWNIQGYPAYYVQHGWIRIFRKGSALGLIYFYTTKKNDIEKMRAPWEKILKDAKFILKEQTPESTKK